MLAFTLFIQQFYAFVILFLWRFLYRFNGFL